MSTAPPRRAAWTSSTITDHDSIEGCLEFLDRHPEAHDFFVSEEVSCRYPGTDIEVHFGVYGTTEALHAALQPLRGNVFDVAAALREAGVFFTLNHLLHFYRGQIPLASYLRLLAEVPALETRNGTMLEPHNDLVALIAERWRKEPGGSGGGSARLAAATRTRCAGSAGRGPKRPGAPRRSSSPVWRRAGAGPPGRTGARPPWLATPTA